MNSEKTIDYKQILTVIVSCYNSQETIAQTLDSLCLHRFFQIKVLVVDDGSNNKEMDEIVRSYCEKYPENVFYYHKQNGNWGSVVNFCLPLIDTPYVTILDSDDTYDSEALPKLLSVLKDNIGKADLYFCNYTFCFINNGKEKYVKKTISYCNEDIKIVPFRKYRSKNLVTIHNTIFSSSIFKTIKQLPEKVSYADNVVLYDCLRRSHKFAFLNTDLHLYIYNIRQSCQSISLEKTINNFQQLQIIFDQMLSYSINRNWERKRLALCARYIKVIFYWMVYIICNDPYQNIAQKTATYQTIIQKINNFLKMYPWMTKYFSALIFISQKKSGAPLFFLVKFFSFCTRNCFVKATSFPKNEKRVIRLLKKLSKINYLLDLNKKEC